jgi:hypothetical protein
MRDSANPDAAGLHGWTGPVQGYANHVPPWTRADFARFPGGHMVTSVRREASWAHVAREIDVENGAAEAADVPDFVLLRHHLGHDDAGAYFSLSAWPQVHAQLISRRIRPAMIRLRVADWSVPPHRFDLGDGYIAWAHQYQNDQALGIDRSAVFGALDFTRP